MFVSSSRSVHWTPKQSSTACSEAKLTIQYTFRVHTKAYRNITGYLGTYEVFSSNSL